MLLHVPRTRLLTTSLVSRLFYSFFFFSSESVFRCKTTEYLSGINWYWYTSMISYAVVEALNLIFLFLLSLMHYGESSVIVQILHFGFSFDISALRSPEPWGEVFRKCLYIRTTNLASRLIFWPNVHQIYISCQNKESRIPLLQINMIFYFLLYTNLSPKMCPLLIKTTTHTLF